MELNLFNAKRNNKIIGILLVVYLFIISFVQLIIDDSINNLICLFILFFSGVITTTYLFYFYNFLYNPISSIVIFGYSLYYFFLPPFATSLEGKPVINNLILPIETYTHAFLFALFTIFFHWGYKYLLKLINIKFIWEKYFKVTHVFSNISANQVIVITVISVLSLISSIYLKEANETNDFLKFLQGISYFVFFPYILSLPELFNVQSIKSKSSVLFIYTLFILILGTLLNGRSFVFLGISSLIILLFFLYIFGAKTISLKKIFSKKVFITLFIFINLIEPATKLSLSFVLARGIRNDVSAFELFNETISQYKSIENPKYILELLKDVEEGNEWDEYYVTNPFLSRLCNLKYTDNILVMNSTFNNEDKASYRTIEFDKTLSIFPLPILKLFGSQINKEEITSGSSGDFLFFIQTGELKTIGTFRTGSLIGSSYILFGWLYLIIVPLIIVIIFSIFDSLVLFKRLDKYKFSIQFSPLVLISLFPILFFLTSAANGSESITNIFGMIRLMIEKPILYLVLFTTSSVFSFKSLRIKSINN